MKRWLRIVLLLLMAGGLLGQATPTSSPSPSPTTTPTATPTPSMPAMCSVTGNVVDAGGNPFKNGTITFNSQRIQVINGVAVNPTVVSTNTDNQGNILAKSMPQGLAMQVTICPGTQQTSNCSAPFSVIIPFSQSADFGSLAQGTQLTGASALSAATLQVSGATTLGDSLTVGSTTQATDLMAGGVNTAAQPTQLSSFVGIGTKGPQIQFLTPTSPPPTETNIGAILWGSLANPNGTPITPPGATQPGSSGKVSAFINGTTGGGAAPGGALQFGTALGDGTSAWTRMELARDGTLVLPYFAGAGNFLGGPGTINVSKGYYVNGLQLGGLQSWTPSFQFGSTVDTSQQLYYGYYTKIGQTVFAAFGMGNVNGANLSTAGSAQICGLPAPAVNTTNQGQFPIAAFGGVSGMVGPLTGMMTGTAPGTCLQLMSVPYSGNGGPVATTHTNYYGANIQGNFFYISAN